MPTLDEKNRLIIDEIKKELAKRAAGSEVRFNELHHAQIEVKNKVFVMLSLAVIDREDIEEFLIKTVGENNYYKSFIFTGSNKGKVDDSGRILFKKELFNPNSKGAIFTLKDFGKFKKAGIFIYQGDDKKVFKDYLVTQVEVKDFTEKTVVMKTA